MQVRRPLGAAGKCLAPVAGMGKRHMDPGAIGVRTIPACRGLAAERAPGTSIFKPDRRSIPPRFDRPKAHTGFQAVGADASPSSRAMVSRMMNFCGLPVTVIGSSARKLT